MSIIQIRSTSGGGKSWVIHQLMKRLGPFQGYEYGRKNPLYYSNADDIVILGPYESVCGGVDNLKGTPAVFNHLMNLSKGTTHGNKRIILCEGLILSEDSKWTSQLPDVRVIYLTTPLEQCIAQLKRRRVEAGNLKPLNELNTRKRWPVIERSRLKLLNSGIMCRRCTAKQAPNIIIKWIKEFQNAE